MQRWALYLHLNIAISLSFFVVEAYPTGTQENSLKRTVATLPIEQGFDDDLSNLASQGWAFLREGIPYGTTSYFQGSNGPFEAQNGTGYIAMNSNSVTGANTISSYLISPEIPLDGLGGTRLWFYTRTIDSTQYPDRLYLKYSTAGSSTSSFNFANTLISINQGLTTNAYPEGYPTSWTLFSGVIPPQASGVTGRFAFHYSVPNGGPNGDNSEYIGIDSVLIDLPEAPSPSPSSSVAATPSGTPTVSVSPSTLPTPSVTPSRSSMPTPSISPSVSVSASSLPSPSASASSLASSSASPSSEVFGESDANSAAAMQISFTLCAMVTLALF